MNPQCGTTTMQRFTSPTSTQVTACPPALSTFRGGCTLGCRSCSTATPRCAMTKTRDRQLRQGREADLRSVGILLRLLHLWLVAIGDVGRWTSTTIAFASLLTVSHLISFPS